MNHNRAISLFFFAALFVATLFVINSVSATSTLQVGGREARADQADIQRWEAMGVYFLKQPASDANVNAKLSRDVNAARWQALGEAYLAIDLRSRQADAARWQAMGDYYTEQLASVSNFDAKLSRDADAARWQALGQTYLAINLGARQADAARWQALGESYLGINLGARQADMARWQALGEYYTKLNK